MDQKTINEAFLEMIQNIYYAENQILKAIPKMMEAASYEDLKQALNVHLKETKAQIVRLEMVFKLLGEPAKEKKCHGILGIIKEGKTVVGKKDLTSAFKDACLIIAAQKIEHYEIATYGCLCAFVLHLSKAMKNQHTAFHEISSLLHENLLEEKKTDKKFTEIAEGTKIMQGINDEAEKEILSCCG